MVPDKLANIIEDITLNKEFKATQFPHNILFEQIVIMFALKGELDRLEMI